MKLGIIIKRHGSAILTGLSVVGVVGTAVAARDGHKREIKQLLEGYKEGTTLKDLSKKEIALLYFKSYWITGLVGGATIASIIFSNRLDAKRIAALTAAATVAEEKFRKYREIIKEKLGDVEEHNIYAKVSEKEWHMYPSLPEGSEERYFYDTFTEQFFVATPDRVQQAIYHLNRNFQLKGHVYFSEFYEFLGLEPTDLHKIIGWSDSYYLEEWGLVPWIDIYTSEKKGDNGVEYLEIYYDLEPSVKAMKDWQ